MPSKHIDAPSWGIAGSGLRAGPARAPEDQPDRLAAELLAFPHDTDRA
jgi:hypothetical protein